MKLVTLTGSIYFQLERFYEFQSTLNELSKLAEFLPQDACTSFFSNSTDNPVPDPTVDTNSTANNTDSVDPSLSDPGNGQVSTIQIMMIHLP